MKIDSFDWTDLPKRQRLANIVNEAYAAGAARPELQARLGLTRMVNEQTSEESTGFMVRVIAGLIAMMVEGEESDGANQPFRFHDMDQEQRKVVQIELYKRCCRIGQELNDPRMIMDLMRNEIQGRGRSTLKFQADVISGMKHLMIEAGLLDGLPEVSR